MPFCCICKNNTEKGSMRIPPPSTRVITGNRHTNADRSRERAERKNRRFELWLERINRADINRTNFRKFRVCSEHFVSGQRASLEDIHNVDWAPSVNLCPETDIISEDEQYQDEQYEYEQYEDLVVDVQEEIIELGDERPLIRSIGTQTDIGADYMISAEETIRRQEKEIQELKAIIESRRINMLNKHAGNVKYCGGNLIIRSNRTNI